MNIVIYTIVLLLCITGGDIIIGVEGAVIFSDDFNTINYTTWSNSIDGSTAVLEDVKCPVGTNRKAGGNCVHFGVTYCSSDPTCYRSELSRNNNMVIGAEYWFGFSIFLPSDYNQDTIAPDNIHFQIHGSPRHDINELWRSPIFAIGVSNMQWRVETRGDPRYNMTDNNAKWYHTQLIGAAQPGQWVDFVVHDVFRFDTTGSVVVWKNGVQSFSVNNTGTCYNDGTGPYMKIGIYKWEWEVHQAYKVTNMQNYYAEVKVGDHTSSYAEVYTGLH